MSICESLSFNLKGDDANHFFITFSQNSGSNNGAGNGTPSAQVSGGVIGINNASGSYSVTNKTGSPQLPAATPHGRDGSNARHSKLKGGTIPGGASNSGGLHQINQSSAKMAKKQSGRDSSLPGGIPGENPNKYVKPSELSLDLIMPTSIRGAKQGPISGGSGG